MKLQKLNKKWIVTYNGMVYVYGEVDGAFAKIKELINESEQNV